MAEKNTKGTMSLNEHRNANEGSSREAENLSNNKPVLAKIETTTYEDLDDSLSETLNKFYRSEVYTMSDVYETLKIICEKNELDFENHCIPAVCLLTVEEKLKKLKSQRPLYIVYWDSTDMWTLTAIAPINDEDYVLFKHPTGKDMPKELLDVIKPNLNKFTADHLSCNYVDSCKKLQKKFQPTFSGPIVLRNMVSLLREITNGFEKKFFDSFKNYELLTTASDVSEEKLKIAQHEATILTTDNGDFVLSCRKFFEMLEKTYPIKKRVAEFYAKLIAKNKSKGANDADTTATGSDSGASSSPPANEKTVGKDDNVSEKIKKYFEDNEKFIPLIGKEYKKHAKSFEIILTILKYSIDNPAKDTCIKSIRGKFGISMEIMIEMMDVIDAEPEKPSEQDDDENEGIPAAIPNLENPTDLWGKSKKKKDPNQETTPTKDKNEKETPLKSLQEIQDEIVYGGTVSPESGSKDEKVKQKDSNKDIELKRLYTLYKTFTGKYETSDRKDIYDWANKNKPKNDGNPNQPSKLNDENFVCEALAVANRALELEVGYTMRHPQVCSCLIMLLMGTNKDNGKLLQIQTGEGKTFTIGITAAVLVLTGHKVDVITSNNILANEGVDKTKALTNLLGISVGCNKRTMDIKKSDRDSDISSGTADAPAAFNIKETDSDQEKKNHHEQQLEYYNKKNKYTEDIVYGAISNFQFDYLKDKIEGSKERKGRSFDYVILDEVDSMLIDNGGHVAKLAEPFPGMENLRSLYIKIWQELGQDIEASNNAQITPATKIFKKALKNSKGNEQHAALVFENKFNVILKEETEIIKTNLITKMKTYIDQDSSLIPSHIKHYLRSKMDRLVENAYFAKYGCEFEKSYIIESDPPEVKTETNRGSKSKNGKVVPVDNENTGVTMKDTIWSHGLHQFVQLKHNLELTFETLTTSFISNLGYVRLYGPSADGKKTGYRILGVTGTMGADDKNKVDEKDVFKAICNDAVDFFGIPPYIESSLNKGGHSVVENGDWLSTVVVETMEKIRDYRSVLIICETIRDVYNLEYIFKNVVQKEGLTPTIMANGIRILAVEADAEIATEKHVSCREVIIATNLAGRGTDFKTTKCLNEHGGIHVIVGFLPCNARVQDQAFGRTARQGNKGTASMIIRKIELKEKDPTKYAGFHDVIQERDTEASKKLEKTKKEDVPEITFKDGLFNKFAEQYQTLKKEIIKKPGGTIVLKDVKEKWAYWLETDSMFGVDVTSINAQSIEGIINRQFHKFMKVETRLATPSTAIDERTKNPYYDILRMREFTELGEWDDGKKVFDGIKLNGNDAGLMYVYYMCKFEIDFQCNRNVIHEKVLKGIRKFLKEVLDKILPEAAVDKIMEIFDKLLKPNKSEIKAVDNLTKAEEALEKEMDQIENMWDDDIFKKYVLKSAETLIGGTNDVEDNEFLKHMLKRWQCLKMFKENIGYLKKKMKEDKLYIIKKKVSVNEKEVLKKYGGDLKEQADEFLNSGYDTLYYLDTVKDMDVVKGVLGLLSAIAGGLLLVSGLYFPPISGMTLDVGFDLLISGITDIIMSFLTTRSEDTDLRTALLEKLKEITQSIISSVLSFNIAKINSLVINKTLHALQTLNKATMIIAAVNNMFGGYLPTQLQNAIKTFTGALNSVLSLIPSGQGSLNRKDYVKAIGSGLSRDTPLRTFNAITAPDKSNPALFESQNTYRLQIEEISTGKPSSNSGTNQTSAPPPQSEAWRKLKQPAKDLVTDFCETSPTIAEIVGNVVKAYRVAVADPENRNDKSVKLDLNPSEKDIKKARWDLIQMLNGKKLIQRSDEDAVNALLSSHIMFRVWKVTQVLLPPRRFDTASFLNQIPDVKRLVLDVVDECVLDPNYSESSKLTMAKLKKKIPIMDELYLDKALLMTRYDLYFEDNTDHKTSPRYKMIKDLRGNVDQQQTCGCEEEIQQIEKEKREKQN